MLSLPRLSRRRVLPLVLLLGELVIALLIDQPASPLVASTLSEAKTPASASVSSSGVARLGLEHTAALPPPTATPLPTRAPAPTASAVPPSPSPRPPTPLPAAPAPRQPVEPAVTATAVAQPPTPLPATPAPRQPVEPAVAATAVPPSPSPQPPTAAPPAPDSACAARVVALVNEVRLENGLLALSPNPSLGLAAQQYAQFIAAANVVSHTADGRTLDQRDEAAGYGDWTAVGENVAGGYETPDEAMAAWLASPGHKANILNPAYRETGVGCAWSATSAYGYFYVQEFGTR